MLSVLLVNLLCLSSGCAIVFRGASQVVTIRTNPPGQTVRINGEEVSDGQAITVYKQFEAPMIDVGGPNRPIPVPLSYDPDPLLIGDAVLLIAFVIPGLVALGVDFGTGCWRDLHEQQVIYVPAFRKSANAASPDYSRSSAQIAP